MAWLGNTISRLLACKFFLLVFPQLTASANWLVPALAADPSAPLRFEIRETPAGIPGIFATEDIDCDSLILRDDLPPPDNQQPQGYDGILRERVREDIMAVKRMQATRQAIFRATRESLTITSEVLLVTVRALWINGKPLDSVKECPYSLARFFPTAGQIGHSCVPNAEYVWHDGSAELLVFANRYIAAGEDITASHLSRSQSLLLRAERQPLLGIRCGCPACNPEHPESEVLEGTLAYLAAMSKDHGLDDMSGIGWEKPWHMTLEGLEIAAQQAQTRIRMAELPISFIRYWSLQAYEVPSPLDMSALLTTLLLQTRRRRLDFPGRAGQGEPSGRPPECH